MQKLIMIQQGFYILSLKRVTIKIFSGYCYVNGHFGTATDFN